ncbi:MAG: ABC transporter ATP-binding protein, partial [Candidatus Marinimicrobia bacterium]|nr:ABC transporter ATP-binding protein [Candidatus Neomarinimicrobiota bacterium]
VAGLEKDNDGFIAIKGSVPDPRNYPKGCPFHPRCDVVKNECFNKFPETKFKNNHSWNCVHD